MPETQLSRRQILMVLLALVIFGGGLMAYVLVVLPSNDHPADSRREAVISGLIAVFALVWFCKLMVDAVRDWRHGIKAVSVKPSGRFNLWFGSVVVTGGIACSVLTYQSAVAAGGGVWTFYYGMIAWGIIQMLRGWSMTAKEKS